MLGTEDGLRSSSNPTRSTGKTKMKLTTLWQLSLFLSGVPPCEWPVGRERQGGRHPSHHTSAPQHTHDLCFTSASTMGGYRLVGKTGRWVRQQGDQCLDTIFNSWYFLRVMGEVALQSNNTFIRVDKFEGHGVLQMTSENTLHCFVVGISIYPNGDQRTSLQTRPISISYLWVLNTTW